MRQIPKQKRAQILLKFQRGESNKDIQTTERLPYSTVTRLRRNFDKFGDPWPETRSSMNATKLTPQIFQDLLEHLREKSELYLTDMVCYLKSVHDIDVHPSTISKQLKRVGWSQKVRRLAAGRHAGPHSDSMADEPRDTMADEPQEAHAAGDDAQPILVLSKCLIRPYVPSDAAVLQPQADNPEIARYMRSTFPSPYTLADAERWVQKATAPDPEGRQPALMNYALCTPDGVACGGIGLKRLADIDEARTLEVGYWVVQEHWSKGITTQALTGFTRWAFGNFPLLRRVEACVWEGNRASERVLRKAGFVWEGLRRKAVHNRFGEDLDCIIYGVLREECEGRDTIDA